MCPGALWPACTEVLRCRKRLMITDFILLRRQETDRKPGTMDKTFRGISATREKVANEFTPQSTHWRNCVYTPENAVRMFMDAAFQDKITAMLPMGRNMGNMPVHISTQTPGTKPCLQSAAGFPDSHTLFCTQQHSLYGK